MSAPKTNTNIFRMTLLIAFVMFFVAIFSSTFFVKLTEKIINHSLVSNEVLDGISTRISLGMLMILCSASSGILLWAYSKNKTTSPNLQKLIFSLGFAISFISVLFGVWLNLLQVRADLDSADALVGETVVFPIRNIDYFSWGFGAVFLVCGTITLVLLWKSHKALSKI